MNHGESVALTSVVVFAPGSFLSRERFHTLFPSSPTYHLPLRNKNGASYSGIDNRRRRRLLLRLPRDDCHLRPEPARQRHLLGCSCLRRLLGLAVLPPLAPRQKKKKIIAMDPLEDAPFPPAPAVASPPPAPVAASPPPAPPVVSFAGPKVFVLSPLRGNPYDVDRYYYSPSADVTQGDYAALLSFAAHYGYPIAIIHCPDIAAFQASYPSAIVRPFSEVPPPFLRRGYELMHSSITSTSPPRGDSESLLSHDPSAPSAQVSLRGNDPPSVVAGIRASSTVMSPAGMGARPPPWASTARPDPDGLDAPLPFMGGMGGPRFFGRSSSSFGHPPHQPSLGSGLSTSSMAVYYRQLNFPGPIPEGIPTVVFGWGHRPPPPSRHGGFDHASVPPADGGYRHATSDLV